MLPAQCSGPTGASTSQKWVRIGDGAADDVPVCDEITVSVVRVSVQEEVGVVKRGGIAYYPVREQHKSKKWRHAKQ